MPGGHSYVADAIAGSDYRRMSKGVVRRATAGCRLTPYGATPALLPLSWQNSDPPVYLLGRRITSRAAPRLNAR
jgi:hypothetical protein